MKKKFEKPSVYRYEINVREEIVGSDPPWWNNGQIPINFLFIHKDNEGNPITHAEGCFGYLKDYYDTTGHMATFDIFNHWQDQINLSQYENDDYESGRLKPLTDIGYPDYIRNCRG